MFFLLSKILVFVLSPVLWVVLLLLFALFASKADRRRNLVVMAMLMLYLFSNEFLLNEVARKWETPLTKLQSVGKYDYAIVLGGFSDYDNLSAKIKFRDGSDRLLQALQLYQQKKVRKLFISGGSGQLLHQDKSEADKVKAFLVSLHIPENDIIMEMMSRNTHENALFTVKWLSKHDPGARCLLVTSAWHMRRAMGCYQKEGANVTAYSTDIFSEPRRFDYDIMIFPNARMLSNWNMLLREWVGYASYVVARYI